MVGIRQGNELKGRRLGSVSGLCETKMMEGLQLWVITTIIIIIMEGKFLEERR